MWTSIPGEPGSCSIEMALLPDALEPLRPLESCRISFVGEPDTLTTSGCWAFAPDVGPLSSAPDGLYLERSGTVYFADLDAGPASAVAAFRSIDCPVSVFLGPGRVAVVAAGAAWVADLPDVPGTIRFVGPASGSLPARVTRTHLIWSSATGEHVAVAADGSRAAWSTPGLTIVEAWNDTMVYAEAVARVPAVEGHPRPSRTLRIHSGRVGEAPTLLRDAGGLDIVGFVTDGTDYYWTEVEDLPTTGDPPELPLCFGTTSLCAERVQVWTAPFSAGGAALTGRVLEECTGGSCIYPRAGVAANGIVGFDYFDECSACSVSSRPLWRARDGMRTEGNHFLAAAVIVVRGPLAFAGTRPVNLVRNQEGERWLDVGLAFGR